MPRFKGGDVDYGEQSNEDGEVECFQCMDCGECIANDMHELCTLLGVEPPPED